MEYRTEGAEVAIVQIIELFSRLYCTAVHSTGQCNNKKCFGVYTHIPAPSSFLLSILVTLLPSLPFLLSFFLFSVIFPLIYFPFPSILPSFLLSCLSTYLHSCLSTYLHSCLPFLLSYFSTSPFTSFLLPVPTYSFPPFLLFLFLLNLCFLSSPLEILNFLCYFCTITFFPLILVLTLKFF